MISVVVPAYNEEAGIGQLYSRVVGAAADWNEDYELLVVDDGSRTGPSSCSAAWPSATPASRS